MGQTDRVSRGSSPAGQSPAPTFLSLLTPPTPRTAIPKNLFPSEAETKPRKVPEVDITRDRHFPCRPASRFINQMRCPSEGSLWHRGKTSNDGSELPTAGASGRVRLGTLPCFAGSRTGGHPSCRIISSTSLFRDSVVSGHIHSLNFTFLFLKCLEIYSVCPKHAPQLKHQGHL